MILLIFLSLDTLQISLDQAIEIGLRRRLEIKETDQSVKEARVDLYDALSDLLPTPSSYYEIRRTEDFLDTTTHTWNLTLSQTIFNTATIYSIVNRFDRLSLAKVKFKEQISKTIYNITETYIRLIISLVTQKNLRLSWERAKENYRFARARYEVGLVSKLDLLQAEIAEINTRKNIIDNTNLIEELEDHLQSLLDTNSYIIPTDTLTIPEPDQSLVQMREEFASKNLLIQAARINHSIAKKDLIFSYLALLPSVSGFLSYSYRSYDSPGSISEIWENKYRSYGLRIDFPILNIKDILFGIVHSSIRKKQSEIKMRITEKEEVEVFQQAIRTIESSLAAIELNRKSVEASKEALRLAQERYRNGKGSLLSLLTAQSDLQLSENNYTNALGEYYLAMAKVAYLVGKGAE